MNEWWKRIYYHFVAGEYVADIWGVVEDMIGDNPDFYDFEGRKKRKYEQ